MQMADKHVTQKQIQPRHLQKYDSGSTEYPWFHHKGDASFSLGTLLARTVRATTRGLFAALQAPLLGAVQQVQGVHVCMWVAGGGVMAVNDGYMFHQGLGTVSSAHTGGAAAASTSRAEVCTR